MDPSYTTAYGQLAWSYFREALFGLTRTPAESYKKAVEFAKKSLSLDEQNAGGYLVLANVYGKTGQFEKAMAAGKKGLSLDPANPVRNALYGLALFNTGQFKEAIPVFEKAIRLDPKPPSWFLSSLGWAYFYTGQNEKAISAFRKYVNHKPRNAVAHGYLGCAYIAAGKPEKAVEMFEKASSLNPNFQVWFACDFAIARVGAGHTEEAATKVRAVLSSHPDNADAYRGLSAVLTSEGKHEEALSMAKKAINLKAAPEAPPYYYWRLGVPYCIMGQYEEAIARFKKSISLWPEYMNGHIGLTASYSLAGRMEEALAQAAEVLKINPKITLEDIAKDGYYNFQKADKARFINALRKAGLK